MYKGIAIYSKTVKTDNRLTTEADNGEWSGERAIARCKWLISNKFSREFAAYQLSMSEIL
jgi:hypothetical protein